MGLFTRKKSEPATRSTSRTATSSEAQAAELRGRARRRLIGALVLVLTAIIVVPLMFDDTSTEQADTPVVLPAIVPPLPEPELAAVTPPDYSVDEPVLAEGLLQQPEDVMPDTAHLGADEITEGEVAETGEPSAAASEPAAKPAESKPEPEPRQEPSRAETKPAPKPTPAKPKPNDSRTDDGSVALALLEGRAPPPAAAKRPAPAAPQQGSFVLQIAAYSTEADAQSRRTNLINSGVTNAYVERAVLNDKTTYRLRVGSFPTRDAAQAAQARLRALGYDNSLLLTQ